MVRKQVIKKPTKQVPTQKPIKKTQQKKGPKPAKKETKQKIVKQQKKENKEKTQKKPKEVKQKKEKKQKETQNKAVKQTKSTVSKNQKYQDVVLGFIGVGTISKSMVNGLCNPQIGNKVAKKIILSPRNEQNSKELAKKYKQATIAKSNQEVIDKSDWIIIGLLTTKIPEILKTLKFRKDQLIINLAAMPNEAFEKCVIGCKNIVRACPLPPIALNVGATIVSPSNKGVEQMFDALGSSVAVKTSHETYSLQGIACLQGAQFQIFQACYDWMVNKQKIDPKIAKKYIMGTFHSINVDALDKINNKNLSFQDLVDEQTPGGLNEQNIKALAKKGVFKQFQVVLDETYGKMTKKK